VDEESLLEAKILIDKKSISAHLTQFLYCSDDLGRRVKYF
jgi:hypothetical protein